MSGRRNGCSDVTDRATDRRARIRAHVAALLTLAACVALPAFATPPTPPETEGTPALALSRFVIASGGGSSSGAAFTVQGSIAQPDADPLQPSSGGVFAVTGGFWAGTAPATVDDNIFSDGFE